MTFYHYIGIAISVFAIMALSILSVKKANSRKKAGFFIVSGSIMGTLVGGSSTVGTAQLAYMYGLSGWWFTLGAGAGCLILALFYAKPFIRSGNKTISGFITNEYGESNGLISSFFISIGSLMSVISQIISATAVTAVVFPRMPLFYAIIFSAFMMIIYIVFGGVKGSGITGILKMLLIYITVLSAGITVIFLTDGIGGFLETVNNIDNINNISFYSLFARGIGKDTAAGLSVVLGVITTQSYAQAIFIAKGEKSAVKGALLGSILIPPIGIGGILVGLYMRAVYPSIPSKTALTFFINEHMPPLLGGIALGTLFIAVVGTGAGLALGVASSVNNDIIPKLKTKFSKFSEITRERILVVLILLIAGLFSMGPLGDTILNFSFMAMALRGATIFLPLCCALWLPGRIHKKAISLSMIAGPLTVLVLNMFDILPVDPLFAGNGVSLLIIIAGYFMKKRKEV